MAVLPGIVGSANFPGRYLALPAVTPANQGSYYTFSTGNTTTMGSVTLTKTTTTYQQAWVPPSYDSVSDTLTFNGTTQSIAYVANSDIHVAPLDFSLQFDFNPSRLTGHQYLVNLGQGYGRGYPELVVDLSNTGLGVNFSTANDGNSNKAYSLGTVAVNNWYRVGIMFYNVGGTKNQSTGVITGGTNYLRAYVNGEVKLQTSISGLPWTSTAGIAFGNDNANYGTTFFQGKMKSIFIGKTRFWNI